MLMELLELESKSKSQSVAMTSGVALFDAGPTVNKKADEVGKNNTVLQGSATSASVRGTDHKITNVRELLATGILEGEEVVYKQKSKDKKILKGRINGLFYSCLCHNESMSGKQFELHANCKSSNANDHILCWGLSLFSIVHHLRTMPIEEQILTLQRMKAENKKSTRADKAWAKGNASSKNEHPVLKDANGNIISARKFTSCQLAAATRNFSDECFIGEGRFGRVYKGCLDGTGQVVAIKLLIRDGNQGNKEFLVEVPMLSLLRHENIVSLVGYCADEHQCFLVYEYMPLGSLEDHLHDLPPDKEPLDWNTRMKIAAGAAKGLEYLHDKAQAPVVYRDFKSSNILLDEGFRPKLSDFGFANLVPVGDKSHVSVCGIPGYCAPEYAISGQLTAKSDVYSFGVVLLELITGRKAIDNTRPAAEENLVPWARPLFNDRWKLLEMADPGLQGRFPTPGLNQALEVASMCIQSEAASRPVIADVVTALSRLSDQIYDPNTASTSRKAGDGDQRSRATDRGRVLCQNNDRQLPATSQRTRTRSGLTPRGTTRCP